MKKESNPTWDYYKLILYVLFLAELVPFAMAVIFGRIVGYKLAFIAFLWIGSAIAGCFLLVVLFNLLTIFACRIFKRLKKE